MWPSEKGHWCIMEKPVLDLDQLEFNGSVIYDAHKLGAEVNIKYFKDDDFHEITCYIDKPMNIWDMVVRCSNDEDREIDIPFNWIVQVIKV